MRGDEKTHTIYTSQSTPARGLHKSSAGVANQKKRKTMCSSAGHPRSLASQLWCHKKNKNMKAMVLLRLPISTFLLQNSKQPPPPAVGTQRATHHQPPPHTPLPYLTYDRPAGRRSLANTAPSLVLGGFKINMLLHLSFSTFLLQRSKQAQAASPATSPGVNRIRDLIGGWLLSAGRADCLPASCRVRCAPSRSLLGSILAGSRVMCSSPLLRPRHERPPHQQEAPLPAATYCYCCLNFG